MATKTKTIRKMGNDTLGRERRQHLKSRISAIRTYGVRENKPKDPPDIAAARRKVDDYDRRQEKAADQRWRDARKAQNAALTKLLVTDSFDEGLRIVEAFEAEARRRRWIPRNDD